MAARPVVAALRLVKPALEPRPVGREAVEGVGAEVERRVWGVRHGRPVIRSSTWRTAQPSSTGGGVRPSRGGADGKTGRRRNRTERHELDLRM
eukprot:14596108-Alexandrium_andersonii.AAC.1